MSHRLCHLCGFYSAPTSSGTALIHLSPRNVQHSSHVCIFFKDQVIPEGQQLSVLFLCHVLSSRLCYTPPVTIQLCMPLGTRVTLHDCVCVPVASLFPFASMEECVENNTCHLHRRSECSSGEARTHA